MADFNYYYFKKYFNKSKIKKINNFIEKNFDSFQNENDGAKREYGSLKKIATVKQIYCKKIKPFFNELESQLHLINQKHFGYDLYDINDNSLSLFNTYDGNVKGHYDWHKDGTRLNLMDAKLTVLVNLSTENYEGGEFLINNGNPEIIKEFTEAGDVLMFQSMILHKVNPVIKGIRKSLTFFLNGPSFK